MQHHQASRGRRQFAGVVAMVLVALVGAGNLGSVPAASGRAAPGTSTNHSSKPALGAPITMPDAATTRAPGAASGIDFGAVVEKVNHAVAKDGPDGDLRAQDRRYRADFSEDGFALTLRHSLDGAGEGASGETRGKPYDENPALHLSTTAVRQGSEDSRVRDPAWTSVENRAERVVAPGVLERVTAREGELEWDFVLDKAPPTGGDLRIEAGISVPGKPSLIGTGGQGPRAWRWAVGRGKAVRMGELVVIDALGTELYRSLPAVAAKTVSLAVPASVLDGARYPLTVDPVISPEYPVSGESYVNDNGQSPAVGFGGGQYLAVWATFGGDIFGTRVSSTGNVMDPTGIAISMNASTQANPTVAFGLDSSGVGRFLVAWEDRRANGTAEESDIYGAFVDNDGEVLSGAAEGFAISNAPDGGQQASPVIAFGGTRFLVAWEHNNTDIHGARVRDGIVEDPSGIVISAAAGVQRQPAVAYGANTFLVVWEDLRSTTANEDIYGARITSAGALQDPSAIAIASGPGLQYDPAVAFGTAKFLVVWEESVNDAKNVYGTGVSPQDALVDVAPKPIAVAVGVKPRVAIAFNGTAHLVVWVNQAQAGSREVRAVPVNTEGQVQGAPRTIAAPVDDFSALAVASGAGGYLVVFQSAETIKGAIVGADGSSTGSFFITRRLAPQAPPAVAFDGANYLLVWAEVNLASTDSRLYFSRVSPAGAIQNSGELSTAAGSQTDPDVAFSGGSGGQFLVVYKHDPPDGVGAPSAGIYGSRVTTEGVPSAGFAISPSGGNNPAVTGGGTAPGSPFLVAWETDRILAARVAANGTVVDTTPIGMPGALTPPGNAGYFAQRGPAISFDGTNYLVVWSDSRSVSHPNTGQNMAPSIFGARFIPGETATVGPAILISGVLGDQTMPSVAFDGANHLVVWQDRRNSEGTGDDIYGARVNTTGTNTGDSVLDPSGVPISTTAVNERAPDIASDGIHNLVIWTAAAAVSEIRGVRLGVTANNVPLSHLDSDPMKIAEGSAATIAGSSTGSGTFGVTYLAPKTDARRPGAPLTAARGAFRTIAYPDLTAPSVPDLVANATTPYRIRLILDSSDNVGVTGYTVYRDGAVLTTVTAPSPASPSPAPSDYTDTVAPSTTYTYAVDAYDAAGNRSAKSQPVEVTTDPAPPDTAPPTVPTGITAAATSPNRVNVAWTASADNVEVAGYTVYRNGTAVGTVTGSTTSYSDTTVASSTTYSYTIDAFDAAGNRSVKSQPVSVTTPADTTAPTVPTGVTAEATSSKRVNVAWTASTDDVAVTGYTVYRDGTAVGTVNGATTSYGDTTVAPATTYSYTVDAFDAADNHSEKSAPASATTPAPDTAAPTVPTGVTATATGSDRVNVSWTASTDNVAVTGYTVYRNGTAVGTVNGSTTSYGDANLAPSTTYTYTVDAFDAANNRSAKSAPALATTGSVPDTTAPTVPAGVTATASGSDRVNVSWAASTDNVAVAGYTVYRNGTAVGTVNGATTSYSDTPLAASTTYSYTVDAFDAASNRSAKSAPATATTGSGSGTGTAGPAGSGQSSDGYWLVASDGGVFTFGDAAFWGSTGAIRLNQPIVAMAPTPTGKGYWLVASDGGIFTFGDAAFWGSTGAIRLNKPVVGMAPTPTGKGYWLVASDGGIFTFGDAAFWGSTGAIRLNQPIVAMAPTPTAKGYRLVASDGGIFTFGDAAFSGSTGAIKLNKPIVAMATSPSGKGYLLVASDGGIFAFGDAAFWGSTGATRLNKPIVAMGPTPTGKGYWLAATDGGIFAFGDAGFSGSTGAIRLNQPIVAFGRR